MKYSCGETFINFRVSYEISQISGLGILIAGALVLADMNEFNHFLDGKITAPPIVLIVTGAIIFFIASLGCYGAIRESPTMLMLVCFCGRAYTNNLPYMSL